MATRYDYNGVEDFVKDRAFNSHIVLKAAIGNDLLFGQILRNVMKHAFHCGSVHAGAEIIEQEFE